MSAQVKTTKNITEVIFFKIKLKKSKKQKQHCFKDMKLLMKLFVKWKKNYSKKVV